MTKDQVVKLSKAIKAMYNYISVDDTYLNIWYATTRNADYAETMNRFYQYISDPQCRHQAPLPADIVVTNKVQRAVIESEKMNEWERAARKRPPKKESFEKIRGVFHE